MNEQKRTWLEPNKIFVPASMLSIVIVGAVTWGSSLTDIKAIQATLTTQSGLIEVQGSNQDSLRDRTTRLETQFEYIVDILKEIKDEVKK